MAFSSWTDYLNPRNWFSSTPTVTTPIVDENSNQWGIPLTGDQIRTSLGKVGDIVQTPLGGIYNAGVNSGMTSVLTPDVAAAYMSSPATTNVLNSGLTPLQQQTGNQIADIRSMLEWGKNIGTAGFLADTLFKGLGVFNAFQAAKEARRQNDRAYNLAVNQANNNIWLARKNLEGRANNQEWFSGRKSSINPDELKYVG